MPLTAATVHFDANVEGIGWHTIVAAPDPGTSHLIYKAHLWNGSWAANWVIFRARNEVTGEVFNFFGNVAWGAISETQVPWRDYDGPVVIESGWLLEVYSNSVVVGGLVVDINYGIDTGYNGQPSDYHSHYLKMDDATGETALPAVGAAPEHKVRHVKSLVIWNNDTTLHGGWAFTRDDGGANPALLWNFGNIAAVSAEYQPFLGEGVTVDEDHEMAVSRGSAAVTNPSYAWASWLEAGGVEDVGPCDTGPWTASQQVIQRRSLELDGAQDRLMTYPTAAAAIGIADEWTLLVWSKPEAWSTNREWLFMLGGLSNTGAIHLSRNTDPAVGGNPYEIEVHEAAVTKKLYRWGSGLSVGSWECAAVVYDGSQSEPDKLRVFLDGVEATPTRTTDLAIGALTDTNRYLGLGGAPTATGTDNDGFYGRIWNGASWSRALTDAELVYLSSAYNSHYDLRVSNGPYVASVELEHYYRPGLRYSPNLGEDFGLGGNLTDLTFENSVGDADLVDDFPGKGLI